MRLDTVQKFTAISTNRQMKDGDFVPTVTPPHQLTYYPSPYVDMVASSLSPFPRSLQHSISISTFYF